MGLISRFRSRRLKMGASHRLVSDRNILPCGMARDSAGIVCLGGFRLLTQQEWGVGSPQRA
jgi:hypothetical protein